MQDRYSLRFEATERRGEQVAIPRTGLTVGRKPGNSLQILDSSVSGKHAELSVDADGVVLRDLGSTNGTRVGPERVTEKRLVDGTRITFGHIELSFHDSEASGPALEGDFGSDLDAPAPATAAGEALERVDASLVARSGKRSPAALVGLGAVVLAALGLGAWFFLRPQSTSDAPVAVEPVPGNLIAAGYSFEGDRDLFEAHESAPAAFLPNVNARRSGSQGVRAELAAAEWALHRSAEFRVGPERVVRARGALRVRGDAEARIGVEFGTPEDAETRPLSVIAWGERVTSSSDFAETVVETAVPPGYSTARVVVLARATAEDSGGVVDADDASAVEEKAQREPAAEVSGARIDLLGEPPLVAQLSRNDRVRISSLRFTSAPAGADSIASVLDAAPITARAEGGSIALSASGTPRPTRVVLRVEDAATTGGLAWTGTSGYRTAGAADEDDGVVNLLLGRGPELVRIGLPGPCVVRGSRDGSAAILVVELGAHEPKLALQLDFSADKGAAEDLAHAARGAEKRAELGAAIARWGELLERFPYEAALVEEAEATRAKLLQQGLVQVHDLTAEAERARFFALPNMFNATRERALAVATRFAGSEVETSARALATTLEGEAAALRRDEDGAERERLKAMLGVLEKSGAKGIADEVRARLTRLEGPQ